MKKYIIFIIAFVIIAIAAVVSYFLFFRKNSSASNVTNQTTNSSNTANQSSQSNTIASTATPISTYAEPVVDFKSRVTKKPFAIYVTPQSSPVQPERFTGYHTGADAEYQDIASDVPVYAIADGTVVLSETASGYGGVFMISFDLNGAKHTALYGHIRPSSLPKVGSSIKKGQQLALLGTGYSSETDGERRHLHFAVLADNSLNIKGYVQNKSELSSWIDPLTLY